MSEEFSSAKAGSNRSFGVVFVVAFALIGLFPLVREEAVRTWALLVSGAFLVPTLVYPQVLAPLNKLWFRFGMLLGRIINPVVMFIMYALVTVSYTHLRAHETVLDLVCRLLLEKKTHNTQHTHNTHTHTTHTHTIATDETNTYETLYTIIS